MRGLVLPNEVAILPYAAFSHLGYQHQIVTGYPFRPGPQACVSTFKEHSIRSKTVDALIVLPRNLPPAAWVFRAPDFQGFIALATREYCDDIRRAPQCRKFRPCQAYATISIGMVTLLVERS